MSLTLHVAAKHDWKVLPSLHLLPPIAVYQRQQRDLQKLQSNRCHVKDCKWAHVCNNRESSHQRSSCRHPSTAWTDTHRPSNEGPSVPFTSLIYTHAHECVHYWDFSPVYAQGLFMELYGVIFKVGDKYMSNGCSVYQEWATVECLSDSDSSTVSYREREYCCIADRSQNQRLGLHTRPPHIL